MVGTLALETALRLAYFWFQACVKDACYRFQVVLYLAYDRPLFLRRSVKGFWLSS